MATYKEKVGTSVVNYAGNYPGAVKGELWYDSTNKDFKYQYANVTAAGSWRTGNSMNTPRQNVGGAGIYTAAIAFGGYRDVPPDTYYTNTELYDGTSWTEVNDLNTGRVGIRGSGTSTSAIGSGGDTGPAQVALSESWNGTNWTAVNTLNQARTATGAAGADNTSSLIFGGN